MMLYQWMYILIDSPDFCLQVLSCSIDVGFLHVERKFLVNKSLMFSQVSMDPSGNFFNQDLAASLRWTCSSSWRGHVVLLILLYWLLLLCLLLMCVYCCCDVLAAAIVVLMLVLSSLWTMLVCLPFLLL
jgi:hypothetical protein